MGVLMDYMTIALFVMAFFFLFFMSIVLWNTGLMSGLRRYGEMGVRLAMGETQGHVYRSLLYESISIGIGGSIIGTAIGMSICYYFQVVGLDLMQFMKGGGAEFQIAMSNVIRAKITVEGFFIGLIPGLFSTVFGSMVSGIGIFKRQTSTLFKELEV